MTYLVQFLSTMLALIVIAKSYADYKRRNEAFIVFLFWSVAWLGIVYIAYFPQVIDEISARFDGGGSGVGRAFGLGLTFLFFVIYRVYVKAERAERRLNHLTKEIALRDIPKE